MCNHFTKPVAGTIASVQKKNAEVVIVLIRWKPIFMSACAVGLRFLADGENRHFVVISSFLILIKFIPSESLLSVLFFFYSNELQRWARVLDVRTG